jgi:hypothetical protein
MPKLSAPILAAIERFERETGRSVADELPDESEAVPYLSA